MPFTSLYVRLMLGIKIKDTTAGFKCYSRKVLEKINLDNIWFVGYAFQIEMKYSTIKLGFKVKEIMINKQNFTKTSNIWGVSNNQGGTNTNRIVLLEKTNSL